MPIKGASSEEPPTIAQEDKLRAQLYGLLAKFLSRPPSVADLEAVAALKGDDTKLGQAIGMLARIGGRADVEGVGEEYHDLFIGVGRGELLPYASYYLTGFLHEKPLAKLRNDMAELGIEREPKASEPEDHIAAIMESMTGLILGRFGTPAPIEVQKRFFETHLESWAPYFFRDLEAAKSSVLYAAVGAIGRNFFEIEASAFAMD